MNGRSYSLGIDFGTTNTVLSLAGPEGPAHLVKFPAQEGELFAFRSCLSFYAPHDLPAERSIAAGPWAIEAARAVKTLGYEPKVAFRSESTFGNPMGERSERVRQAVAMLDEMDGIDFEYEGEMPPELALDPESRGAYPFMRLTGPANVLVMPAIHSAAISTQLVQALGGATLIGPILVGLEKSVQIVPLGASVTEIITAATFAAYEEGARGDEI